MSIAIHRRDAPRAQRESETRKQRARASKRRIVLDWLLALGCVVVVPYLFVFLVGMLSLYEVSLFFWLQAYVEKRTALSLTTLAIDTSAATVAAACGPYLLGLFLHQRPWLIAIFTGVVAAGHLGWIYFQIQESGDTSMLLRLIQWGAYPRFAICCALAVILGYQTRGITGLDGPEKGSG